MIFGKHINRYYLKYAGWLIAGLLSLVAVDYLQLEIPKLYGINLSQPQYNDMETIYRNTVDRGIAILAFNAARAAEDEGRAGGFHHLLSIG